MPPVAPVTSAVLPFRVCPFIVRSALVTSHPSRFTDLMIRHCLERADERRVVPLGAAVSDAGVEELLRSRGVRKRDPHRTGARQREREVFLVQLDTETRVERALD